jgi:hypothetical protein
MVPLSRRRSGGIPPREHDALDVMAGLVEGNLLDEDLGIVAAPRLPPLARPPRSRVVAARARRGSWNSPRSTAGRLAPGSILAAGSSGDRPGTAPAHRRPGLRGGRHERPRARRPAGSSSTPRAPPRHQERVQPSPPGRLPDLRAPSEGVEHLPERARKRRVAGDGQSREGAANDPEREVMALSLHVGAGAPVEPDGIAGGALDDFFQFDEGEVDQTGTPEGTLASSRDSPGTG